MDFIALKVTAASVAMVLVLVQGLLMLHLYANGNLVPWSLAMVAWIAVVGARHVCNPIVSRSDVPCVHAWQNAVHRP